MWQLQRKAGAQPTTHVIECPLLRRIIWKKTNYVLLERISGGAAGNKVNIRRVGRFCADVAAIRELHKELQVRGHFPAQRRELGFYPRRFGYRSQQAVERLWAIRQC